VALPPPEPDRLATLHLNSAKGLIMVCRFIWYNLGACFILGTLSVYLFSEYSLWFFFSIVARKLPRTAPAQPRLIYHGSKMINHASGSSRAGRASKARAARPEPITASSASRRGERAGGGASSPLTGQGASWGGSHHEKKENKRERRSHREKKNLSDQKKR